MNHEGYREVPTRIGKRKISLALGNCGIAMFRLEPEKDYLDYWEEKEEEEETEHWWTFRQRELLLWMGGIAVLEDDKRIMEAWEESKGSFTELTGGWRPPVSIWDETTEAENEWWLQGLLKDLNETKGLPDSFWEGSNE